MLLTKIRYKIQYDTNKNNHPEKIKASFDAYIFLLLLFTKNTS